MIYHGNRRLARRGRGAAVLLRAVRAPRRRTPGTAAARRAAALYEAAKRTAREELGGVVRPAGGRQGRHLRGAHGYPGR